MAENTANLIFAFFKRRFEGDHSYSRALRDHLARICIEFVSSGLADPKYVTELTLGSNQAFWACISEALIASRLHDKEFPARDRIGAGPDFLVMNGTRRVWIEVICPGPSVLPTEWLNPNYEEAITFPHEEILLRWTAAIKTKAESLIGTADGRTPGYLATGVVQPEDAYVIAVNGCQLRSGPSSALFGISQFPVAAEAVFPIGPYQLRLDRKNLQVMGEGHQHRPHVINRNGAPVPALTFLDFRFNPISAIWAVDFNGGACFGNSEPSAVVHNPNALNQVPIGFLPADDEYVAVAEDDSFVLSKWKRDVGAS